MRSSSLLPFLAVLLSAPVSANSASSVVNLFSPLQSPSQQQSPSIQVSVNRVNVGVVVTDPQGNFIPNLAPENFHILDNGVEQPITDFANVISPAEVFLLVEAGPAVYFLASTHVNASHSFLDGLSSGDRIAVAAYLGSSNRFENALGDFAEAYADLTESDHGRLAAAVTAGEVAAQQQI